MIRVHAMDAMSMFLLLGLEDSAKTKVMTYMPTNRIAPISAKMRFIFCIVIPLLSLWPDLMRRPESYFLWFISCHSIRNGSKKEEHNFLDMLFARNYSDNVVKRKACKRQ